MGDGASHVCPLRDGAGMSGAKHLLQSHRDTFEENMLDALRCVRVGWGDVAQSHVWVAIKAANAMGDFGDARQLRRMAWRVQNWLRAGCTQKVTA